MKQLKLIIIAFCLTLFSSCNETDEFGLKVDLTFINSTETDIQYSTLFELAPNESFTFSTQTESSSDNENIETCCNGILEDFQGAYNQVSLVIDDINCLSFDEGVGPTDLDNFESIKLNSRRFSYTYTITTSTIADMQLCSN
jgi:hypothetical protein